jgi:hypothetical protein
MGYCSDVRSLIYGPLNEMTRFIVEMKIRDSQVFKDFENDITIYDAEVHGLGKMSFIDLNCEDVKWYPQYEEVERWGDLLAAADERELYTEFARVGEGDGDQTDIERSSNEKGEETCLLSVICNPRIECDIKPLAA